MKTVENSTKSSVEPAAGTSASELVKFRLSVQSSSFEKKNPSCSSSSIVEFTKNQLQLLNSGFSFGKKKL